MKNMFACILGAGLLVTGSTIVVANQINTGGDQGAYHSKFCPLVSKALAKAQFSYKCETSDGSRANIERVSKTPTDIGFSQADVYAYETSLLGGQANFSTIRNDIGRECLFLVTKDETLESFGDVAARATELNFVLPPEQSGSSGTFQYLADIDPDGLGRASNVIRADSTDTALDAVLSSDDKKLVTLFVQFPDPDNARFKKIAKQKGRFIPVIDRNILRQEIAGQKIYYPEETEVVNANWVKAGEKLVTACTPMILFTGHPDLLPEGTKRKDHKDLITTLKNMDASEFRPEEGYFSSLFKKTREMSSKGVENMIDMSEKAREKAAPMMEDAKEMGKKALEDAKPMLDQAKEASKKAFEKAKDLGNKALQEAGEMADKAKEEAEKIMKKDESKPPVDTQ